MTSTRFFKADHLLHRAVNRSQIMLMELEAAANRTNDPENYERLMNVQQLLLEQTKLITEARSELRHLAPKKSPIHNMRARPPPDETVQPQSGK